MKKRHLYFLSIVLALLSCSTSLNQSTTPSTNQNTMPSSNQSTPPDTYSNSNLDGPGGTMPKSTTEVIHFDNFSEMSQFIHEKVSSSELKSITILHPEKLVAPVAHYRPSYSLKTDVTEEIASSLEVEGLTNDTTMAEESFLIYDEELGYLGKDPNLYDGVIGYSMSFKCEFYQFEDTIKAKEYSIKTDMNDKKVKVSITCDNSLIGLVVANVKEVTDANIEYVLNYVKQNLIDITINQK